MFEPGTSQHPVLFSFRFTIPIVWTCRYIWIGKQKSEQVSLYRTETREQCRR